MRLLHPLGRVGRPEEVAAAFAHLCGVAPIPISSGKVTSYPQPVFDPRWDLFVGLAPFESLVEAPRGKPRASEIAR